MLFSCSWIFGSPALQLKDLPSQGALFVEGPGVASRPEICTGTKAVLSRAGRVRIPDRSWLIYGEAQELCDQSTTPLPKEPRQISGAAGKFTGGVEKGSDHLCDNPPTR